MASAESGQPAGPAPLDVGELIEKTGCSEVYEHLEECLGEHDRDWRRCQARVRGPPSSAAIEAPCLSLSKLGIRSQLRCRRTQPDCEVRRTGESVRQVTAFRQCVAERGRAARRANTASPGCIGRPFEQQK